MVDLLLNFKNFARTVGVDYKNLNKLLQALSDEVKGLASAGELATSKQLEDRLAEVKAEIMGGVSDETLDTIEELANAVKGLKDSEVADALVQQITELREGVEEDLGNINTTVAQHDEALKTQQEKIDALELAKANLESLLTLPTEVENIENKVQTLDLAVNSLIDFKESVTDLDLVVVYNEAKTA